MTRCPPEDWDQYAKGCDSVADEEEAMTKPMSLRQFIDRSSRTETLEVHWTTASGAKQWEIVIPGEWSIALIADLPGTLTEDGLHWRWDGTGTPLKSVDGMAIVEVTAQLEDNSDHPHLFPSQGGPEEIDPEDDDALVD